MKTMHGAFFLPVQTYRAIRLAPTPTNISTKSNPISRGTPAAGNGARQQGFTCTRGSDKQSTLGILLPRRTCADLQNSTIS
jgi:hypothetical protein